MCNLFNNALKYSIFEYKYLTLFFEDIYVKYENAI